MNGLLPIIRRKRRPLVVAESVPDGPQKPLIPTKTEPVQSMVTTPPVEPANELKPNNPDETTPKN
jgi:hypothetical protein